MVHRRPRARQRDCAARPARAILADAMRAVTVALGAALLACAGDPETVAAPVDAPATVADALAAGWSIADVTVTDRRGQRQVQVALDAVVTVDAWGASVNRARAPAGGVAPASPATLNLHVSLAQVDGGGRATRTLTNRFDGGPARAAFAQGRRVLALVAPDEAEAGAWRVWHAYALAADGALAEPAMGLARGADPTPALAP